MPNLVVHNDRIDAEAAKKLVELCPFGAIEAENGAVSINSGCKMCRLCVKNGPVGAIEWVEEAARATINKDDWRGVAVFAETEAGEIAPVVLELLGKAQELAATIQQPVYAVLIGSEINSKAEQLLRYGADTVYVYDAPELAQFRVLPYAAALEDFIHKIKPGTIMVGATNLGRSLAPRVAARFATGLTADCTMLEMKPNTDLVQIRPAFGGNIMAQIITPNNRPQFCTVRYKVFNAKPRCGVEEKPEGIVVSMQMDAAALQDSTKVIRVISGEKEEDISEAEAIVAVGRGLRSEKDLELARQLADALNAQLACTRPLIENGWFGPKKQIGLSGRTVKPKIIVTLGVSGAVQFTAGMNSADCIIAVNSNPEAPIFDIAHYGLVGDIYEIVPALIKQIQQNTLEVG